MKIVSALNEIRDFLVILLISLAVSVFTGIIIVLILVLIVIKLIKGEKFERDDSREPK